MYLSNILKFRKTVKEEPHFPTAFIFPSENATFLENLCLIHAAENYCLRRMPRLVNLVEISRLSQLLSDHVSNIMDRLNILDDIFFYYRTRPSYLKGIATPFKNLNFFLVKGDKNNKILISDLIEASQYRVNLYELIITASTYNDDKKIYNMLMQVMIQEKNFYENLTILKNEILIIC